MNYQAYEIPLTVALASKVVAEVVTSETTTEKSQSKAAFKTITSSRPVRCSTH